MVWVVTSQSESNELKSIIDAKETTFFKYLKIAWDEF